MSTVVGIFERRSDAERATGALEDIGISKESISLLTRDFDPLNAPQIPENHGERPGMVKGLTAVTGGVMGLTAATLLLPGIGTIMAIGMAGGALLGSLAGGAVGGKIEEFLFPGIPEQELFLYEDALRKGRTGVLAVAADDKQADAVRGIFEYAGAESIDRARHMWWLGIRDIEKEKYEAVGDFSADEPFFRTGFEAALLPRNREKTYEQYVQGLRAADTDRQAREAFRRGYERGRAYLQQLQKAA